MATQQKYRRAELKRITWDEYSRTLETLYKKIERYLKRNRIDLDVVVPIFRGGAVPGAYLAYRLKLLTILPVQYKYLVIDGKGELRRLLDLDKNRIKNVKRPVFLLVENNHCFGDTAQKAARDLKMAFPKSRIIYAAAHADYTHRKLKLVDAQFYGRLTNETRGLTPKEAKGMRISNCIFVFPWESFDEELKAVNSQAYAYQDIERVKSTSKTA